MAPTYMVDSSGQLVMSGPRNMGVRLVSPHGSLLVPAAPPTPSQHQQGKLPLLILCMHVCVCVYVSVCVSLHGSAGSGSSPHPQSAPAG